MRTLLRIIGTLTLGCGLLFIALQNAVAADATILVFGDSLSAAFGIPPQQGWVALLTQRLQAQGYGYQIVNASVSGETTEGGVTRLPRALQLHRPTIVVLELGANDALRGLPLASTRANLDKMIRDARAADARVLLVGIRIPPNYGARYGEAFANIFPELAKQYHLPLVPFLLQDVALNPARMQEDGMHPNAAGELVVLETVWPYLQPLIKKSR